MNTGHTTRRELGAFLRAAREQLDPADLGLPTGQRRRTPGLRREEVAAVSGVGLAWYTWLEQGRVDTSRQVLDALARVLRVSADERRHLLMLGGYAVGDQPRDSDVDELRPLLESWSAPALLLDQRFTVLERNSTYSAVWPEHSSSSGPAQRPNLLVSLATSPSLRHCLGWDESPLYELFLRFRARADWCPDDQGFARVWTELHAARPDLAHWWRCRAVRDSGAWHTAVTAPDGTVLRLAWSLLQPGHSSILLLVQAPVDLDTAEWIDQASGNQARSRPGYRR